jgi:hypothetical protein
MLAFAAHMIPGLLPWGPSSIAYILRTEISLGFLIAHMFTCLNIHYESIGTVQILDKRNGR